jgi:hypothetical protein
MAPAVWQPPYYRRPIANTLLSVLKGQTMPKAPKEGHGIALTGRNEEQPVDAERAQDPSSPKQDAEQGNKPEGQSRKPDEGAN